MDAELARPFERRLDGVVDVGCEFGALGQDRLQVSHMPRINRCRHIRGAGHSVREQPWR
jgi:hypothetical protein